MRKLYEKFFYIPKHGKVRDNVMIVRSAFTLAIMVVCLIAMSVTAYAYFSANVTSGANIIKAANFDVNISVTDSNTKANVDIPTTVVGRETVLDFKTPGTYTVTLAKAGSADTGFCIVSIGSTKYHTQQLGIDINANNAKRDSVSFCLKINEANTKVTIESHWGTSSHYGYDIKESNNLYIMSDPLKVIEIGEPVNGASVDGTENISEDKSENTITQSENIAVPDNTVTNEPATTEQSNITEPTEQENITESAVTDTTAGTENQFTTDNE